MLPSSVVGVHVGRSGCLTASAAGQTAWRFTPQTTVNGSLTSAAAGGDSNLAAQVI